MATVDIVGVRVMLNDPARLDEERTWAHDGELAHLNPDCAQGATTEWIGPATDTNVCRTCWVRDVKSDREFTRDWLAGSKLAMSNTMLDTATRLLESGSIGDLATYNWWLDGAESDIASAATSGTSQAAATLGARARQVRRTAQQFTLDHMDDVHAWAISQGAASVPWPDLADRTTAEQLGTDADDDSGLHVVYATWRASMDGSGNDTAVAAEAAAAASSGLKPYRPKSRKKPPVDPEQWATEARARSLELATGWGQFFTDAASVTNALVLVGVVDGSMSVRGFDPLDDVFGRSVTFSNEANGTVIALTTRSIAYLLEPYAAAGLLGVDTANVPAGTGISFETLETISGLWDPSGDGAYASLQAAVDAARALED